MQCDICGKIAFFESTKELYDSGWIFEHCIDGGVKEGNGYSFLCSDCKE